MKYDFESFYLATFARFVSCEVPDRPPDYYTFSGSTYWNTINGVIRWSNHWGQVNSCHWLLDGRQYNGKENKAGFCRYEDFYPVSHRLDLMYGEYADVAQWREALVSKTKC